MENYTKGETVEEDAPPTFPQDEALVEMRVNAGSKIWNLMGFAMKKIKVRIAIILVMFCKS